MRNKIKGIPVAFLGIILLLALTIDVPMVLLHRSDVERFNRLDNAQLNTSLQMQRVIQLVEPTPTATPSATPTVTPKPRVLLRPTSTVQPTTVPSQAK